MGYDIVYSPQPVLDYAVESLRSKPAWMSDKVFKERFVRPIMNAMVGGEKISADRLEEIKQEFKGSFVFADSCRSIAEKCVCDYVFTVRSDRESVRPCTWHGCNDSGDYDIINNKSTTYDDLKSELQSVLSALLGELKIENKANGVDYA